MNRRSNGTFKKKSKLRVLLSWTVLLVIVYVIVKGALLLSVVSPEETPAQVTSSQTEECMKDAKCKAQIENSAAQIVLQKEIDREKAAYEAKMQGLNQRMEELRKQELSLQ